MKYRIVVVTLVVAGKLASAGEFTMKIGSFGRSGRSGRSGRFGRSGRTI